MNNWNAHNWQRSHAEVLRMRKQIRTALRAPFALAAEQRKDFASYVTQLEDVLHGGQAGIKSSGTLAARLQLARCGDSGELGMSFDNSYPNRKDWRKPYHRSKRFDRTCRPHGSCSWCEGSRLYQYRREVQRTEDDLTTHGFIPQRRIAKWRRY